jgi:predicted transcriptional regulator
VQQILHLVIDAGAHVQYDLHVGDHHEEGESVIMSRFTTGELKVMRLLWEHGELKPAELQARFPEPIKNPALRSYLTTLLEKGHVTRRRMGKAFYYKAVTRSRSAFRTMLADLVDAYCGGSARALVMNIIKSERLSAEDLLELKHLADGGDLMPPSPEKRSRK